ncbi:hypothetical protein ACFL35_02130 [Candidatus Riflebacteria bacterium]
MSEDKKGLDERTYSLLLEANQNVLHFNPRDAILLVTHLPAQDRLAWIQAWRSRNSAFFEKYDSKFLHDLKQGLIYSPQLKEKAEKKPIFEQEKFEIYFEKIPFTILVFIAFFSLAYPVGLVLFAGFIFFLWEKQKQRRQLEGREQFLKLYEEGLAQIEKIRKSADQSTFTFFYENLIGKLEAVRGIMREFKSCSQKLHSLLKGATENIESHINELSLFLLSEEDENVRAQLQEQLELALQTITQKEQIKKNYQVSLEKQRHMNLKIENIYRRIGVYESTHLASGGTAALKKSLDVEMQELNKLFELAREEREKFDPVLLPVKDSEKKELAAGKDYISEFVFPELDDVDVGRKRKPIELKKNRE